MCSALDIGVVDGVIEPRDTPAWLIKAHWLKFRDTGVRAGTFRCSDLEHREQVPAAHDVADGDALDHGVVFGVDDLHLHQVEQHERLTAVTGLPAATSMSRTLAASRPGSARGCPPSRSVSSLLSIVCRADRVPLKESSLLTGPLEPTCERLRDRQQYGASWISAMSTNLYGPGTNFDRVTAHVLSALSSGAVGQRHAAAGIPAGRRPRRARRPPARGLRRAGPHQRGLRQRYRHPRAGRDRGRRRRLRGPDRPGCLAAGRRTAQLLDVSRITALGWGAPGVAARSRSSPRADGSSRTSRTLDSARPWPPPDPARSR